MPSGAAVIRYDGKRGTVWRIKYADATGRQVMETVGAERDGVTRRQGGGGAARAIGPCRAEGLPTAARADVRRVRPNMARGGPAVAGLEARTVAVYRNALDGYLAPAFGKCRLD